MNKIAGCMYMIDILTGFRACIRQIKGTVNVNFSKFDQKLYWNYGSGIWTLFLILTINNVNIVDYDPSKSNDQIL